MKIAKKFSSIIIALVVCAMLVVTAWAADEILVTYAGTWDDSALCVDELSKTENGKTVTLSIKANDKVDMDGLQMQVKVPEGLTLAGISNTELGDIFNYNLENGMIVWYAKNADDVNTDLLASVSIAVPKDTAQGEYEIECQIIDISRDWGFSWEDGQTIKATLTVGEHVDGGDNNHLCDYCDGAVEGEACVDEDGNHKCDECGAEIEGAVCDYKPGEYVWSEDYSTCTVEGTCACGEKTTANATVTSKVTTTGTCQTEEVVTYTAEFIESWAENQTKEITGEKNPDKHDDGKKTTNYTDNKNGTDHAVTVTCECGAEISTGTETHINNEGKDHKCDLCKAVVSECSDAVGDGDHKCDECGEPVEAECVDAKNDGDHKCDECGKDNVTTCGDSDPKDHICDTDSACTVYSTGDYAHTDGENQDNKCDYCEGFVECETCEPVSAGSKEATCTEPGFKEYYQCKCGKYYYLDDEAYVEIPNLEDWKAEGGKGYLPVNDNHVYGTLIQATDATHTQDALAAGVAAHYHCSCGKYFTEDKEETTLKALTGEMPVHAHAVYGKDDNEHWSVCSCGLELADSSEPHDYSDGNCVCGAEKPADPVSNIAVVDKTKGTAKYTVDGSVVTVTSSVPCRVGYLQNGVYVAIPAVVNDDGSYSFTAPEGVAEVLLVIKGDVTLDGQVLAGDVSRLNASVLEKTILTAEALFAADATGDGQVLAGDGSRITASILEKRAIDWDK